MFYCFSGCSGLVAIWADAGFSLLDRCTGSGFFYGCGALVGGAGTVYDFLRRDEEYCRIDGGVVAPRYLTVRTGRRRRGVGQSTLQAL